MKKEIKCFSFNENARLFQSIGVEVFILDIKDDIKARIKEELILEPKVIIIDEEISDEIIEIKEKYDEEVYPIFLTLPFGEKLTGKSLNEMKKSIEQAIGISVF